MKNMMKYSLSNSDILVLALFYPHMWASVTRFVDISPLWQILKVKAIFKSSFSKWQTFEPTQTLSNF